MEGEYEFEGRTVEAVYESHRGDYWVLTDTSGNQPVGYAYLADMPQFAEWGLINPAIFDRPTVWEVPEKNWTIAGPEDINIQRTEEQV